MSAFSVSPGSYKRELDLSQRIRAVSTSIGAMVSFASKGPIGERVLITNEEEFVATFGKPNPKISYAHYCALEFLKRSSRLYFTRVVNDNEARALPLTAGAYCTVDSVTATNPIPHLNVFDDGNAKALGKYDPYNMLSFNPNTPGIENVLFFVCAANPGDWNNELYVRIRSSQKPNTDGFDDSYDDPYSFYVEVFTNYRSPRQTPDESFLVKRIHQLDGFGSQMFIEDVINNRSNLIRVRNNELAPEVKILTSADVYFGGATNGAYPTYGQVMRGWDLYKDPEESDVNILIQGGTPIGISEMQDIADIQRKMASIAQDRMDCIAVLDIPSSEQKTSRAIAYRREQLNLDSSYAAIYSPDVKIKDTFNDLELYIPPSGHVAASYAFTDEAAETWFAPAGMQRGSLTVLGSREIYNQGHRDALTDSQINAIRFFPNGSGFKIWGADTMQVMASALCNVNVRRLLNFIEKSISIAALYNVFDPNDDLLRTRLKSMCERFLQPIMDGRGLYWFSVVCDDTNNTPASIANGDINLDVYLDPVIPAKRIKLNAFIMRTGANFKEYVQG